MKTGIADLPLHYGKAPAWLFRRMKELARYITIFIINEQGPEEMLKKLSNPFWFQAFGCVLGFDWHSSGLTTTVCGALKEGIKGIEKEMGLFIAGGKGGTSRKTPQEIEKVATFLDKDPSQLIYASKMSAKVDSSALQDGFQLYHHCFIFSSKGAWTVIQQGMNTLTHYARRYHWLGIGSKDFVCEPHSGICCDIRVKPLNMVAQESQKARKLTTELSREKPERLIKVLKKLQSLNLPAHHQVLLKEINPERLSKIFLSTYEKQPQNFERLLGIKGVGPKTIRALTLISEIIYATPPSFQDPVRYSFAHGGKDGYPYPVDRKNYDLSIQILKNAINHSKIERSEKANALQRLFSFYKG
ncbi:MAG: DUF763 domain-containing protein [Candidatus Caldatribacteriota bacterium]